MYSVTKTDDLSLFKNYFDQLLVCWISSFSFSAKQDFRKIFICLFERVGGSGAVA